MTLQYGTFPESRFSNQGEHYLGDCVELNFEKKNVCDDELGPGWYNWTMKASIFKELMVQIEGTDFYESAKLCWESNMYDEDENDLDGIEIICSSADLFISFTHFCNALEIKSVIDFTGECHFWFWHDIAHSANGDGIWFAQTPVTAHIERERLFESAHYCHDNEILTIDQIKEIFVPLVETFQNRFDEALFCSPSIFEIW